MEQKNILNEVSALLNSTSENLDFVISNTSPRCAELLQSIRTTLTNTENVLKRVSEEMSKENAVLKARLNVEKACKNQAYFFILENGFLDGFAEYCKKQPLDEFNETPIERIKRKLIK